MAREFPPSVVPGIPRLGQLPSGWSKTTFGDVLKQVYRRVDLKDSEQYQLVTAKRSRGGIVPREQLLGSDIAVKSQYRIREGDFLISKRQIVHGACGIVPRELDDAIVSNEYVVLGSKGGILLDYLSYFAYTNYFQQTCFQSSIGVHIEKMLFKLDDWFKWNIYLPPLAEQRAIARILGTWDEAIALTESLIEALQQRKKGLMQKLLTGEVRFPGFDGEWETNSLGKYATVKRGASPRPIKDPKWFSDDGRGWIRIADINAAPTRFLNETTQYLSDLGVERSVSVEVGELILSIAATIGVPKVVNIPACIHDGFVLLKDYESKYERDFLYHFLTMLTPRLSVRGQPGTQKNINSEIVRHIQLPEISKVEQRRITDVLNDSEAVVHTWNLFKEELQQQKKGLMQQLLTGQVRVTVGE